MGKIRVLDENLIKKIAAGEVVERPASVVKELVENAIDAGATRIKVAVRAGGKQSIVVTDDGMGIAREDIGLCVHRHATSKMSSAADLFKIETLGFRGEALASIGAVSHLAIESRMADDDEGTRLVVEGGVERERHGMGRARGTTITVRNLFFNTPARRKFLRHIDTEARHVTQVMIQLAASYPSVGFELEHQHRNVLQCAPTEPLQRAADLLGVGREGLVTIDGDGDGLAIQGALGTPEHCNRSKGKRFLVIRGRPIQSRAITQALYRGYGGLLPEGRHPMFMLWLNMDPRKIDVNVHPTKREIRLAEEGQVAQAIEGAIRQALRMPDAKGFVYDRTQAGFTPAKIGEPAPLTFADNASSESTVQPLLAGQPSDQLAFSLVAPAVPRAGASTGSDDLEALREPSRVWQLHNRYILVEVADGLLLVDQQAAHERVKFTAAMAQIEDLEIDGQQLLFPLKLEMSATDYAVYKELSLEIDRLGFTAREFGERTVLVEAIPGDLVGWGEGEAFYQLLNDAREEQASGRSWRESTVLAYVRKASIAAGQKLWLVEMENLLDQLTQTDEPHLSPSGKPTMNKLQLTDINKLFDH